MEHRGSVGLIGSWKKSAMANKHLTEISKAVLGWASIAHANGEPEKMNKDFEIILAENIKGSCRNDMDSKWLQRTVKDKNAAYFTLSKEDAQELRRQHEQHTRT